MAKKLETGYTSMTGSLALCLTTSSIMIAIFSHLIRNTKSRLKESSSIILSYLSILCYLLFAVNKIILSIYNISAANTPLFDPRICAYGAFHHSLWTLAKTFMYTFFIVRLYAIFKSSSMLFSAFKLKMFVVFLSIGSAIPCIILFTFTIAAVHTSIKNGSFSEVENYSQCSAIFNQFAEMSHWVTLIFLCIMISFVVDIAASVSILRLYLKRLVILSSYYDNMEDIEDTNERHTNARFYSLMLKMTHLIVTIVSTSVLSSFVCYSLGLDAFWVTIDHTINVLCIYLSFGGFNNGIYNKLCCIEALFYKCCTRLCFCCCIPEGVEDLKSTEQSVTTPTTTSTSTLATMNISFGDAKFTVCTETTTTVQITQIV